MRNIFSAVIPRPAQPGPLPTGDSVEIVKNPDGSVSIRRCPGTSGPTHPTSPRG